MGWFLWGVGNVVVTSVTIGALKREGIIEIHTDRIRNEMFRSAFETAVGFGEDLTLRAENLIKEVTGKTK